MDATEVRSSFELSSGVYVLGNFETGLTVYSQQVRAHNLAWSIARLEEDRTTPLRIAIVGGGIAGLTVAAGLAAKLSTAEIYLLEKRAHLCPLQLGCDTRWLHPRVYDWPAPGSRVPSASLPLLNWSEGRASDVAHRIVNAFRAGLTKLGGTRIHVFVEVDHLKVDAAKRKLEWTGSRVDQSSGFAHPLRREGRTLEFDEIVIAAGFGVERKSGDSFTPSYWRNETFGQPVLDGSLNWHAISGFGDGALVDLCRLTINQFRQDRILEELFIGRLPEAEKLLAPRVAEINEGDDWFDVLAELERTCLAGKVDVVRHRLRTDSKVGMHLAGRAGVNRAIRDAFRGKASFANRMMFYLLFRCGAFEPILGDLGAWLDDHAVRSEHVVWRHGSDVDEHIVSLFVDKDRALADIQAFRASGRYQQANLLYPYGFFPADFRSSQ